MAASNKPNTIQQLKNLMSQHTAMAQNPLAPPARENTAPLPRPVTQGKAPVLPTPAVSSDRYSIRLVPTEAEKVNAIVVDAIQRLGQRVNFSDILRIGLSRFTSANPITVEEVAVLRSMDRRRHGSK